jgi:hypothetical protein
LANLENNHLAAASRERLRRTRLVALIFVHVLICSITLLYALHYTSHHVSYDGSKLPYAIISVMVFSLLSSLFVIARFSFGYFVGFYFFTMVFGFLWLSWFTDFRYNHQAARLSAVASLVAFLLPALFISSPLPRALQISAASFERFTQFLLALAVATIALAAISNFRVVGLDNIYDFRPTLQFPTLVRYLIGIVSNAVLPFLFACFVTRGEFWRAGFALLLLFLFYPITLTKIAFFAPAWLVGLALLSRIIEARLVAILSLSAPMLAGIALIVFFWEQARSYFDVINFRMITVPSSAINVYNAFFSTHDLTHFCQILILKQITSCPYQVPLAIIMEKTYGLGSFNASLFATEGIASVGTAFAPVSVFFCGLLIALGNRASAGLPPCFILVSGGILPQIFLNVPLTTAMLTHGTGLLFLLWYLTPRVMFEQTSGTNE